MEAEQWIQALERETTLDELENVLPHSNVTRQQWQTGL